MFSVIIPSMQKNEKIFNMLLSRLDADKNTGEIIIIDNSLKGIKYKSDKIKVITPEKNIYVNPAWNLGVKTAKFPYAAIINDDLIFPEGFFQQVLDFLKNNPQADFTGSDTVPVTSEQEFTEYPPPSKLKFTKIKKRCSCFGIAMFFKTEKYIMIPDELKIWFGDDYLFYKSKNNYKISNSNIKHVHSLTSSGSEFRIYKELDLEAYKKLNPDFKEERDVNFFEHIFSVKNEYEERRTKKRKVIYLFGFKIKLKAEKIRLQP